jgi:hypothetical protein
LKKEEEKMKGRKRRNERRDKEREDQKEKKARGENEEKEREGGDLSPER